MSLLTFVKLSNPKFMPLICMYYVFFSLLPVYSLCETFKKWLFFLLFPLLVLIKACDICIFLHCHCGLAFNHQMALFAFSLDRSCPFPSPPQKHEGPPIRTDLQACPEPGWARQTRRLSQQGDMGRIFSC